MGLTPDLFRCEPGSLGKAHRDGAYARLAAEVGLVPGHTPMFLDFGETIGNGFQFVRAAQQPIPGITEYKQLFGDVRIFITERE